MTTDELLASKLQALGGAAPEITMSIDGVIPRARRRRAATRTLAVGGATLLVGTAWVGFQGAPWSAEGTPPAGSPTAVDPTYEGGEITEVEYIAIVTAVRDCMVDRGFSVSDVARRMDGVSYGFTIDGGSGPGSTTGQENLLACEDRVNLMEAEVAYQAQSVLAGAERDVVFDLFTTCMSKAGFSDIDADDTASEILDRLGPVIESEGREAVAPAEDCWNMYGVLLYG